MSNIEIKDFVEDRPSEVALGKDNVTHAIPEDIPSDLIRGIRSCDLKAISCGNIGAIVKLPKEKDFKDVNWVYAVISPKNEKMVYPLEDLEPVKGKPIRKIGNLPPTPSAPLFV